VSLEESERVLVVAPLGRDAEATVMILHENGFDAERFDDLRGAAAGAHAGAGAMVVAEEAMTTPQLDALATLLDQQAPWSDLPLVVLSRERHEEGSTPPPPRTVQRFNVTILERPLAVRTLVAAVQVALRARRRQYEVRSLLEQRLSLVDREKEARMRAESASRAKDEFLAMLGHELRNPLSPIVTALHIIRQRHPTDISHELTVLDRQVAHLSRLVDDLLDVSRIAQGKVEVKHDQLSLEAVVARSVEMASPLFEQRRHELTVSVDPSLYVLGDLVRLSQVFANLLTNAAKYTQPGGHVSLRATREGDEAVVRVRDDGVGIAPEMLPRVFDLFVQEKQTIERSSGGLGLGLAIVRNLVALHGGRVAASSGGPGQGSEFVVRLDALRSVVKASADGAATRATPRLVAVQRRILVVDDNEDAAELLAFTLQASGYATRVAQDGLDALGIADEFQPDLAVLDIGLPVMDGYELAKRLKSNPALEGLSLIALTGYGQQEDVRRALAAGFDEHLVKPVDLDRLHATVQRLLRRSERPARHSA
jgi:signal transduction histidine kinase/ActR/RegA family two-component response regulator